jgi:HSP20 family molecular chaperone IbpA
MDPFGEIDDMFNRLPAVSGSTSLQAFVPAINMYENDKALIVEMPLAGVKPENVEVNVQLHARYCFHL